MAIADSLIAGETIVFESRKHWIAPIRASLTAGLMVIAAAFIRWLSPSGEGLFGPIGGIGWVVSMILLGYYLPTIFDPIFKWCFGEQFEIRTHKRLIYIYQPDNKTIEALNKGISLPPGVDLEIKPIKKR